MPNPKVGALTQRLVEGESAKSGGESIGGEVIVHAGIGKTSF